MYLRTPAVVLATAAALLSTAAPASGYAQTYENALLIVLDVSGSMKEDVDGGVKSDLAVRGLLRTLADLPLNTAVSLRLLGEGAGDASDDVCSATRQAVGFGPFDRDHWSIGAVRRFAGTEQLHWSTRCGQLSRRSDPRRPAGARC